jgi:DNA-binding HxlR family transcriptional regulator
MKSLQERLKALLAAGMITRTVYEQKLPKVEHSITPRGQRLFLVMSELKAIACEMSAAEQQCQCPLEGFNKDEMDCPKRRQLTPRQMRRDQS